MIPSDRRSLEETSSPGPSEASRALRGTLPPPEWRTPKADGAATIAREAKPLGRRTGPRAEEGWRRGRLEEARASASDAALREACAALARWLASRDRDIDEAVELAAAALQIGQDVELRRELSAWLEGLGEAARAAAVLKPIASLPSVESNEAAFVLVRTGLLKARAGSAAAAAAAFEAALSIDAVDPLPAELLGALSGWPRDAISTETAVDAYVEAARRRAGQKQEDGELEDLWRAFATAPSSEVVATALSGALDRRGRSAAADEVLRAHAKALPFDHDGGAARIHARRRASARLARDPVRALGAALDEGLDTQLEGEGSAAFDAILLDLGMLEAVAARLERRARRTSAPAERADLFVELGRLLSGPLADPGRGAQAYGAALLADPSCEEALAAARRRRDPQGEAPSDAGSEGPAAAAAWASATDEIDARARASALERIAASEPPPVRALLLAVAAERHLAAGEVASAFGDAVFAAQADASSARCAATLADAAAVRSSGLPAADGGLGGAAGPATDALERAIGIVGPRLVWCAALARALDARGETELAVGWTQRYLALCPCDRVETERLFDRLVRAGDSSRLRDALSWLLSQPQPMAWSTEPFARALSELARLDADRAAVVARRALEVFGPKSAALREAMLGVAQAASDDGFAVAILERWLSCGAEGSDRRQLFVRLCELRERLGDDEGVARIAARALREGLPTPDIEGRLAGADDRTTTSDAQLWRLRATAERVAAQGDPGAAAGAWRNLGAALWDLADDRVGAIGAWQRAARCTPRGYATFALDLVAFAGPAFAFGYLTRLVETEADDSVAAAIAADAADSALVVGEASFAFDLAARGLARDPRCAGALGVAEGASRLTGGHAALSALYDLVGERAFGRFGRRAAHYRGARFFERAEDHPLALKHAAQAFDSVPSEGSTFQFLARAARRAGDRALAMRAVEQVAESERRPRVRATWLLRAASMAGEGEDGARQRVDLLLRAALALPGVETVAALRAAARELLRLGPEERDGLELRVGHAARTITGRLGGPEGARVAIAFATTSLDLFADAGGALASFGCALACDADVDEFDELAGRAAALAEAPGARDLLTATLDAADRPHANVGVSALRLLAAIAGALGDGALRARAAIAAAVRAPEDDALVIAAEQAAASAASPEVLERFAGRISAARRAEALIAAARARVGLGAYVEAAPLFERAIDLVDDGPRRELERELRAAWDSAGRRSEIEARAHQAAVGTASPSARADGWMEVADLREKRGELAGAVEALLEACRLDPEPLARWSALERVAETAGDDGARVAALEQIETRVKDDGRTTVRKRLARVHERQGDLVAAERAWQRVLAIDADDEDADQAIESLIVARGSYDELVDHLARRAQRLSATPGKSEILRAVRLRRAAVLEQRLGRTDDARGELELLLREWPDHPAALRYLADLFDRQAEYGRSAPLWRRAAAVEANPAERDELELRAMRAARAAGDMAAAHEGASRLLERRPSSDEALDIRLDAARALGADLDIGDALDVLAAREMDERRRAAVLLESARVSARGGDLSGALDRARRAASADPTSAAARLFAREMEYRVRGAGAPDEARRTIEELSRIGEPLEPGDTALRAFLLAEALDVVRGGSAGLQELEATRAVIGQQPLLSLGLAERLAAQGHYAAAVAAYRAAASGPLLDLRRPGAVALAGAEVALRAGSHEDATYFLEVAAQYEDAQAAALGLRSRLTALRETAPVVNDVRLYDLEAAVQTAKNPLERARARLALARGRLDFGDARGAEPLLWEALADGLTEAGDVLAPLLASSPERMPELVRVRCQQVALEPGDVERLESLRAAALADDDRIHARAVEHVLRAFDPGAGPLAPPPLTAQPEQPGILALLTRPSMDAAGEAFALMWEGAMQLFVREAASYGITGVERIVPGPSSPLARLYDVALRTLDAPRIPLFASRVAGPVASHVALLAPASVILTGDVRQETPELWFELGRGLAAALPHNVLRRALPVSDGRTILDAMRTAFGSPALGRRVDSRTARLAESFWQIIPARAQRRLQELLRAATFADYEELVEASLQSGRRVGMFLAGDFAVAARSLLAETARADASPSPETLRELCLGVPALADLLRLAVRPEYADARWHLVAPATPRRTASSGRFSRF